MSYPFHAHGVHFQVLDINGAPPPENLLGWKDTVLVDTANTVRLIGTFKYAGIYMLHCHNLKHEDDGMMLQYQSKWLLSQTGCIFRPKSMLRVRATSERSQHHSKLNVLISAEIRDHKLTGQTLLLA